MLDLIIRGGEVVSGGHVAKLDIAVQREQIISISKTDTITEEARRIIDASGHIVVPGGIDLHTHLAWPIPAIWAKREGAETQSPEAGSLAAAFGGTTSIIDFAMQTPSTMPLTAVNQRIARFEGHSYIDFGFHCALTGEIPFEALDQIGEMVALACPASRSLPPLDVAIHQSKLMMDICGPQCQRAPGIAASWSSTQRMTTLSNSC